MNRNQERRANEVLDLYIACHENLNLQDIEANKSPSKEGFNSGTYKPSEALLIKVDRMGAHNATTEQRVAYRVVMNLRYDIRTPLTLYKHFKGQHNPLTQKPFTHEDCAKIAGFPLEKYQRLRAILMPYIADSFDKRMKMETVKIREVV